MLNVYAAMPFLVKISFFNVAICSGEAAETLEVVHPL